MITWIRGEINPSPSISGCFSPTVRGGGPQARRSPDEAFTPAHPGLGRDRPPRGGPVRRKSAGAGTIRGARRRFRAIESSSYTIEICAPRAVADSCPERIQSNFDVFPEDPTPPFPCHPVTHSARRPLFAEGTGSRELAAYDLPAETMEPCETSGHASVHCGPGSARSESTTGTARCWCLFVGPSMSRPPTSERPGGHQVDHGADRRPGPAGRWPRPTAAVDFAP